jgi:hypothetical protein
MWRGATAGALSTCKERQMSHFGLARALGEALALLSGMSSLSGVDEVGKKVHDGTGRCGGFR